MPHIQSSGADYMKRLKIANRTALDMGDMFGITIERRQELSKKMDEYASKYKTLTYVYMSDVYDYIADITSTKEEFVWLLSLHIQWMYRTGRDIKLQPDKK